MTRLGLSIRADLLSFSQGIFGAAAQLTAGSSLGSRDRFAPWGEREPGAAGRLSLSDSRFPPAGGPSPESSFCSNAIRATGETCSSAEAPSLAFEIQAVFTETCRILLRQSQIDLSKAVGFICLFDIVFFFFAGSRRPLDTSRKTPQRGMF